MNSRTVYDYFEKITDLLDEALSKLRTDEFDKLLEYIEEELEDYKMNQRIIRSDNMEIIMGIIVATGEITLGCLIGCLIGYGLMTLFDRIKR